MAMPPKMLAARIAAKFRVAAFRQKEFAASDAEPRRHLALQFFLLKVDGLAALGATHYKAGHFPVCVEKNGTPAMRA
jgi:hypothetical protein